MNTAVAAAARPLELVETLAHELRQPLSAIESTAFYLAMVLPRGEIRAQQHASHLRRLVDQANWILSCAEQLADVSPLAPQPLDLEELIMETAAAQMRDSGFVHRLQLNGNLPLVRLDPARARCLIENLFAMLGRASNADHPVQVRTSHGEGVILDLSVHTPGSCAESGFGAGASLGIQSARGIVEAHGGEFGLDFDARGGASVRILFQENVVLP